MKKINKGLILTIIVLLALTIYLTNLEKQREAEKPNIKKACEDFILFTDKYSVLPEEMQKLGEEIQETQLEEYSNQMKADLKKLMISNDEAVELQYRYLDANLENRNNKIELVTMQKRRTAIDGYEFDGDKVTVKFYNKVNTTVKYLDGVEERVEDKEFETSNDEIILQKVDGQWKVVYSNLQFNESGSYYGEKEW